MNISFDNTNIAFAYKSTKELKAAKFLFNTMDYPWFSAVGVRLTPFLMKTGLPIHGIIRKTIFKQFVGGETLGETAAVGKILSDYNVQVILDYGVEGKEGEANFEAATACIIPQWCWHTDQVFRALLEATCEALCRTGCENAP